MARRGFKFTVVEIEHLHETIEDVIPIEILDWERIWQEHSARYPTKEPTSESLKRKFQELARKKNPTGDPNCPPYVRDAKRIFHMIVQATDGSTGGSDVVTRILVRLGLRGMTTRRGMKMMRLISVTTMRMTIDWF